MTPLAGPETVPAVEPDVVGRQWLLLLAKERPSLVVWVVPLFACHGVSGLET